ncbi:hypothetical protein ADIWIN_3825 [Winogradskyella psychrotolerans RS-3]|uniref:DUF2007 domain-containing protein n=1 Tax=Winogradskyella psychrotolerans RS-3 TaxID=641526 RepID=S7VKB7_9FLAO|nr:DUF2007 domain-containing protein [Winogradskyella psychrotolerans]EPR69962.1 hypothetical protein ADIWIN_3825 [Winogradskyella psychrotolerans RS-3]
MQDTFVTIAKFQYSTEAEIIKGRLESDGIKVFLKDNITIDTDPLVSNAIGGIKLNVLAADEAKAKDILNSIKAYSLNDDGEAIVCPNCGKHRIELYSTITNFKSLVSFLIAFITGTLPFSARYQYKCEDCKTEFPIKN